MARRLNLQSPLVFEQSMPRTVRRLTLLLIILPAAYLIHLAVSNLTGGVLIVTLVVLAVPSFCFCLFALDQIETVIIVDADGIERRSLFGKIRLLWDDGLRLQESKYVGLHSTNLRYDVSSANASISFTGDLRNHTYLRSLIDAGINSQSDSNSIVRAPLATLDTTSDETSKKLLAAGVLCLLSAIGIGLLGYSEVKELYLTPTVAMKDLAQYAGKDSEIRVSGKLHTEPPVVSRDNRHSYGFQFVRLDDASRSRPVLTIVNPTDITVTEGSDRLTVRAIQSQPNYFGKPHETVFKRDWQKSDVGKMVAANTDESFKDYEQALPNADHKMSVWNIEQGQPITVTGRVKNEDGELILQPSDNSLFWLMPNPNKQLEQDVFFKVALIGALIVLQAYLFIAAYIEAKRTQL